MSEPPVAVPADLDGPLRHGGQLRVELIDAPVLTSVPSKAKTVLAVLSTMGASTTAPPSACDGVPRHGGLPPALQAPRALTGSLT